MHKWVEGGNVVFAIKYFTIIYKLNVSRETKPYLIYPNCSRATLAFANFRAQKGLKGAVLENFGSIFKKGLKCNKS